MKVLITGVSGFIGHRITEILKNNNQNQVIGTYFEHKVDIGGCNTIFLDITQEERVKKVFDEIRPDVVVHCAAISEPDRFKDFNRDVNVLGTENIVKYCKSKLIFISTDYIFDGKKGLYTETDEPNPTNYYGKSKFEGERIVERLENGNYVIVRTSLVYGWPEPYQRSNFVVDVIRTLEEGEKFYAFANQYRTPTYVGDLARGVNLLIENDARGIFNLSGGDYLDRYSIAVSTARVFGLNENLIVPEKYDINVGDKPLKAGLQTKKAEKYLGYKPRSVKEGLKAMRR